MPICYPEGRCLIMDAYADYEFYIINYRGKAVSETDFPVAVLNASQFIRMLTVAVARTVVSVPLTGAALSEHLVVRVKTG